MKLPRKTVQFISACLFGVGSAILCAGGWNDELLRSVAISFMAGSIWYVMMSESVLLGKVQHEMTSALESLRKKQESEVQDLLYFLRQSQISANPMESWDGAKKFLDAIRFPAMVLTPNHQIVKANERMTRVLGMRKGSLDGTPAHIINDPFIMSRIGELCSRPPYLGRPSMHTKYAYLHKSGKKISGVMAATLMGTEGFFVVFHPDADNVISSNEIKELLDK